MKTNKNVKVDKALRQSVLDILDKLYKNFYLDRSKDKIAVQIMETYSSHYCNQNCPLHFRVEEIVIPYLKKLNENQRLELVKNVLTDGFLDIDGFRHYLLYLPYLNYNEEDHAKRTRYTEKVPDAK